VDLLHCVPISTPFAHYREVMGSSVDPNTGNNLTATPVPADPISRLVFDLYKATFRKIFRIQKI
jgi:hypothetical protein